MNIEEKLSTIDEMISQHGFEFVNEEFCDITKLRGWDRWDIQFFAKTLGNFEKWCNNLKGEVMVDYLKSEKYKNVSVSHGTMRTCDLIEAFVGFLKNDD